MGAKLVAEEGVLKGLVLPLEGRDQWIIGRDPEACQLLVEDPAASRRHLACHATPEGIWVENLSTTNPIEINDNVLAAPHLLQNGDAVKIGSGIFRFYTEGGAKLIQDEPPSAETASAEELTQHTLQKEPDQENREDQEKKEDSPTEANTPTEEIADDNFDFEQLANLQEEGASSGQKELPHSEIEEAQSSSSPTNEREEDLEAWIQNMDQDADSGKEQQPSEMHVDDETAETLDQGQAETEIQKNNVVENIEILEDNEQHLPVSQEKPEELLAEQETPSEQKPATEESDKKEVSVDMSEPSESRNASTASLWDDLENSEPSRDSIFEEQHADGPQGLLAEINFDIHDTGRWLLKVVGGPNTGAEFAMQQGSPYVIGTDPNGCDIILHDTSVSRQHAKITVQEDESIVIEDLNSRNGTIVDGEALHGSRRLESHMMVTIGTTSFLVYDREGEMQTIIAPLLPSIVKVLQKDETKEAADQPETPLVSNESLSSTELAHSPTEKSHAAIGAFVMIGIIVGLFVLVGVGTTLLFKSEPVATVEQVDASKSIADALAPFPSVKWSYNKSTGRLLLVGHVLTASDKNQLMYNLGGFKFIKHIDDSGIIIDEYVWREINQVMEKNPSWKGITVYSPAPGHFVISGTLQTKAQSEKLNDFLSANFPYLDLLEKRVLVEEEVVSSVSNTLQNMGLRDLKVSLSGGDLILSGGIPPNKAQDYEAAVQEFKQIPGIRNVRSQATQLAPESSVINITNKYEVSGYSQSGNNVNVVINGRILTVGDNLDGMTLTSIKPHAIFFEKDGVKYRVDFSR